MSFWVWGGSVLGNWKLASWGPVPFLLCSLGRSLLPSAALGALCFCLREDPNACHAYPRALLAKQSYLVQGHI